MPIPLPTKVGSPLGANSMAQKLVLKGTLPNMNDLLASSKRMGGTRGGRGRRWSGYAELKRQSEMPIVLLARAQLKPVEKPVKVSFYWVEPNRRRDLDGIAAGGTKLVLDALQTAGILPNDNWKWIKGIEHRFGVDKDNPRVEVRLEDEG